MSNSQRILVLARSFPPQVGGSATLMYNLLKSFPLGSYMAVSNPSVADHQDAQERLDVQLVTVSYPRQFRRLFVRYEFVLTPFVLRAARRLLSHHSADLIFVNYPSTAFLIAGYILSRQAGLPLHVYMHDLWADNIKKRYERYVAQILEQRILHSAAQVYSITDASCTHLSQKHQIPVEAIPHPVNIDLLQFRKPDKVEEPATILYTGSIYELMNQDAIRAMAQALHGWERNVRLILVTSADPMHLRREGIDGPAVEIRRPLPRTETLDLQRQATILYLPLAFQSTAPLEIQTVFPIKTTDYLVAGRPILVHAPRESYTATYARKEGWGLPVETCDPDALRTAISRLLDESELRRMLIAQAEQSSRERDVNRVSGKLQDHLFSHG